jgi:hypothetical protein
MNRASFGTWGSELDDDGFARAVATAGVLVALRPETDDPTAGGRLPPIDAEMRGAIQVAVETGEFLGWRNPLTHPAWPRVAATIRAELLALMWPRDVTGLRVGLIADGWESDELDPSWIAGVLTAPPIEAASSLLLIDRPAYGGQPAPWQWPLRIGFLPDPRSRQLYHDCMVRQASGFMGSLTTLRRIGHAAATCDLLIVPMPLRRAVASLLENEVRCAMVVLTGQLTDRWRHARPLLDALRSQVEASVVVFASTDDPVAWLTEFIRSFSHDEPLDVALHTSARRLGKRKPLMIADRRFLANAQLSIRAELLAADLDRTQALMRLSAVDELKETIGRIAVDQYHKESGAATELATVEPQARALMQQAKPRWLQSQVLELTNPLAPTPVTMFASDSSYAVDIRIGLPDATWMSSDTPFPEHQLPPQERPHRLTVVLSEPDLLLEPQVQQVLLPKAGPSTVARFLLRTLPETTAVRARVLVTYGNRILQTALLQGGVLGKVENPSIRLETETIVRLHTDDLADRRRFDAALVLNHNDNGRSRVDGVADGHAAVIDLDNTNVVEAKKRIKQRFEEIVKEPEAIGDLELEGTRKLLLFLATKGRLLHGALKDFLAGTLIDAERLQIVAAKPDAYLPLEFCYDYQAPNPNAKVCPSARDALAAGSRICPGLHTSDVVCPLGFWALSKVIERHIYQPLDPRRPDRGYRISEPTADRDRLPLTTGMIFAASNRVDKFKAGTVQRLADELGRLSDGHALYVKSWKDWTSHIKTDQPSVLLLLPHTPYEKDLDVYGLEIAHSERLWASQIAEAVESYIQGPDDRPVIALLLGCATAGGSITYEDFPALFRRAGAEIVVGTLPKILGRHAASVGELFLRLLFERGEKGQATFGEIMRDIRRRAVLNGIPMALALVAYGDADWILEAEQRRTSTSTTS